MKRHSRRLIPLILALAIWSAACGGLSTPRKIKTDLGKVAAGLNSAAKTNRQLYQSAVYGAVGSPQAIAMRQKVAGVVYESNEVLIVALDIAKGITADNFAASKTQILALLSTAASKIAAANIVNPQINLILQAVAALINNAVVLVQSLTSADIRGIERLPASAWPKLERIKV